MPYIVENDIDPDAVPPGDGPILIVIRGTRAYPAAGITIDMGPQWWQPGSDFDRWLCARIRHRTGAGLDSGDILRFVWSGENSESAREEAATMLLALIRELETAGRPISIVAHDHGGNVARRACEMAAIARSSAPPWSVVCIGTPFFHYGLAPGLRSVAFRLASIPFWWACFTLATDWLAAHFVKADAGWYALLILLLAINSFRGVPSAFRKLDLRRYRARSRFADRGVFTNLWSTHDEALALLRPLNTPVSLMRQMWEVRPLPQSRLAGWLTTALAGLLFFLFLKYALSTVIELFASFTGAASFATVVPIAGALLFVVAVAIAALSNTLADFPLDLAITRRLRALAYGNYDGAAITGVELFPWQHGEASAVVLPRRIEDALEACVTGRADAPDARLRASGGLQAPRLIPDIGTMVDRALTNSDLAHSAYFRVEPIADLVAEALEKSGQWQRERSPAA